MSNDIFLQASIRTIVGHPATRLRKKGLIPAVVYGHGVPTESLSLSEQALSKVYREGGESMLIDLAIDDRPPVKVLMHELQWHPVTHSLYHVDFYQVKMDEKIRAEVEILFTGEAPAVKELGGILVKNMTHVEVECLPGDLPAHLPLDLSSLRTFEDHLRVSDITLPPHIVIHAEPQETVVAIEPPRSDEELQALEEQVVEDVAAVEEVEKKEKEEKEEAAPTEEDNEKTSSEQQ